MNEAVAAYRAALADDPGSLMANNNLGQIYIDTGRYAEAEQLLQRAVQTAPKDASVRVNLGVVRQKQARLVAAVADFEAALAIDPANIVGLNSLAGILSAQGRAREAMVYYRLALALPARDDAHARALHSNYLFALHYERLLTPAAMFAEHRAWAQRYEVPRARLRQPHDNTRDPARRIRIGYVSPDFGFHSVAYFIGAVLAAHDREGFEVYCYSTGSRDDAMTRNLRNIGHAWRDIRGSDDSAAAAIRADKIDLLIDLAGHTAGNRLALMALKPAPVQLTYLGYPDTTGLSAIGYRITDARADPPGESDTRASETLLRLPGGFLAYRAASDAPPVSDLPATAGGAVTFASFNNLAKLSDETVALWSRVLAAVPRARLMLKARVLDDADARAHVAARFAAHAVAAERLILLGHIKSPAGHLAAYHQADIALDPVPYNGTTTSCEALWMGVPVVTQADDRHSGRVGASLLHAAGLSDWVTESPEAYVALAAAKATDVAALRTLRAGLRERLRRTPLFNPVRLTRELEAAYRGAWRRWCAEPA
jgi:predicted O-linked N-acetylglucosamine transferase (SPINDLY family)